MFINSISLKSVHFHEVTFGQKGQKQVDLAFDPTSKAWSQRVIVQLCKNENEALYAKYGLSKPHNDQDGNRRNLDLTLDDPGVVEKLIEFDNYILDYATENSKTLFKKELTRLQVEAKYKSLLKQKEGVNSVSVKVKCNPVDKPTPIKVLDSIKSVGSTGDFTSLTPGCKVVPVVRMLSLWFMTDTFGLSLQADKLLVIPGKKRNFLDDMILTKSFVVKNE